MKKIISAALLTLAFSQQWCTLNAMKTTKEIQCDLVTVYCACGLSTRQAKHSIYQIITFLKKTHAVTANIRRALDIGIPQLATHIEENAKNEFFDAKYAEFTQAHKQSVSLTIAKNFIFSTLILYLSSFQPEFCFVSAEDADDEGSKADDEKHYEEDNSSGDET